MRRFIASFLILVIAFIFIGCSGERTLTENEKLKIQKKDKLLKEGRKIIEKNLELTMQGKEDEDENVIKDGKNNKKYTAKEEDIVHVGYHIQRVECVGENLIAKVEVYTSQVGKPYFALQNLEYTIGRKGSEDIKIIDISEQNSVIFFEEEIDGKKSFMFREKKVTSKVPVFSETELPPFVTIKTGYNPEKKVKIQGNSFGAVAISRNKNKMVVIVNENKNSILISVDKTSLAFNSDSKIAEGTGGAQNFHIHQSNPKDGNKGVELEALDFFENSTVDHVVFAPSGDNIYVQIRSGNKVYLSIYSNTSNKPAAPRIMQKFNSDKYSIVKAYFSDNDKLILKVNDLKKNKEETYILDVKNDKIINKEQAGKDNVENNS